MLVNLVRICVGELTNPTDLLTKFATRWFFSITIYRNYNPEGGRGRKNPVSREVAMEELLQVVKFIYSAIICWY